MIGGLFTLALLSFAVLVICELRDARRRELRRAERALKLNKTCETCYFYDELRTRDKLDPVTKKDIPGELKVRVCGYNKDRGGHVFELTDMTPCEHWKPDNRTKYEKRTYALMYWIEKHPPTGGSGVPRKPKTKE